MDSTGSIKTNGVATKWLVMVGVGMGVLMATLDSSIVNISLPTLVEAFETNFATVQWVVISYLVVVSSLILGAARLGDMYDKKKLYIAGMILFTTGSLLCAISSSVNALIAFRALQGLGATLLQALGMAIITEVFPAYERGRALGIQGTIVAIGIALGPPLGGIIIGLIGWHWVFLVNLPVGIIALIIVTRFLPSLPAKQPDQRFDILGAMLMFTTLGCYALGMTLGQRLGFNHPTPQVLLVVAAVGLVSFIILESRLKQPMVDLRLFRNVFFDLNLLMGFLVFIVMSGSFILPFFLELVQGYSPTVVGMLIMVHPIASGMIAPLAGSLSDRFGSRGISLIGLVFIVCGALAVSTLQEGMTPLGFAARIVLFGIGMGLFASPNNSAIMGAVPPERLGVASGLLSLSRTLGNTTGLPLIGAIFTTQTLAHANLPANTDITTASPAALVAGIQGTYQIAALFILASTAIAVVALWLDQRRKKTAAKPVSPPAQ
jgi:EmrB/QacA subfamily drug resistance transporter